MTAALQIVSDENGLQVKQENKRLYTVNLYNEDDSLTQNKWAEFQKDIKQIVLSEEASIIHGLWYSGSTEPYQSMSLSFNLTGSFPELASRNIRGCLVGLSEEYPGCIIQWTEADVTYF